MRKTGKADLKERFIELRAEGRSYADAAALLGVSKTTLIAWGRELREDVTAAKRLRTEALFERFAVSREKRIEAFGKRLKAILAELDKRDLKDVKTDALLSLALRYGERLAAEAELLTQEAEKQDGRDSYQEVMDLCRIEDGADPIRNMTVPELRRELERLEAKGEG